VRTPVRKLGDSAGILLPEPLLAQLGVEVGDDLDVSLDDGRVVLTPAKNPPRAGWAEAARQLAEAGDDVLVWPEFGNVEDASLKW
jgi:antitoxin MazE